MGDLRGFIVAGVIGLSVGAGSLATARADGSVSPFLDLGGSSWIVSDSIGTEPDAKSRQDYQFNVGGTEFLAQAPEGGEKALFEDADEAARQTSNPLGGDFMVLINEWNIDYFESDDVANTGTKESYTHVFQPVIPFSMKETIGPDWILVNRPTLPIIYEADVPSGFNPNFPPGERFKDNFEFSQGGGLADISHFSLLGTSVSQESSFLGRGDRVLAAGFSLNIPSGTDGFSNNVWAAGPAAVGAFIGEKGILGALVQTQFDFADAGVNNGHDVMILQPFYYWNLGDGWQVGGAPLMQFDFNTYEHQIPIGMGLQKTHLFQLGGGAVLPVRFGLEGRYHVAQNDFFGQEYSVVLSISPILPNIFSNMLRGCPLMSVGGC